MSEACILTPIKSVKNTFLDGGYRINCWRTKLFQNLKWMEYFLLNDILLQKRTHSQNIPRLLTDSDLAVLPVMSHLNGTVENPFDWGW